jgi:hypothetical protein
VSDTNLLEGVAFTSPGYFPLTYDPFNSNATSGTFTMPANDVTFEVEGYENEKVYTMALEVYDQAGNPLTLPDKSVRSGNVTANDAFAGNIPATWTTGLVATSKMSEFIWLELPANYGDYKLESLVIEANGEVVETPIFFQRQSGTHFYFQPQYSRNSVARAIYTAPNTKTLTFTGYDVTTEWNVVSPGEVRVYSGYADIYNASLLTDRTLRIREDINGEYNSYVTLDWGYTGLGTMYTIPLTGDGYTAQLIKVGETSSTYLLDVTDDATIAIGTEGVPLDLKLGGPAFPNSPNNATFGYIDMASRVDGNSATYSVSNNFKEKLDAENPPVITKVEIKSASGLEGFPKTVTDQQLILDAIEWPTKLYGADVDEGGIMRLNVRELLGLSDDYVFPVVELPFVTDVVMKEEYTVTVEWSFGYQLNQSASHTYTFELGPQLFAPGEITTIGVIPLDLAGGKYYRLVAGLNMADMLDNAMKLYGTPPLLTFVSEEGFTENQTGLDGVVHSYASVGADKVVLNGHAYFVKCFGTGEFYIDDDNGTVRVKSVDMRIGSADIPIWLPIQIGSGDLQAGSDTLNITLNQGQEYSIPAEIPEYHKDGFANAQAALESWKTEVDALLANTVNIVPGDTGVDLSIKLGEYELNGLTAKVDNIALLGHGFNAGGEVAIQIPGTKNPVMRVAIVMMTTDNTAMLIPLDNVWAEGEATIKLPDWIGGAGGTFAGVFNTYTQDMGFEGEVNFMVLRLAGSFYLARSERLNIPILDRFSVEVEADAIAAGLGVPPAPAQILEIQGFTVGVSNLADYVDYDPRVSTIPTVQINFGAYFRLVEVIGFSAETWMQPLSAGVTVSGGVGIGPLSIDVLEELSFGAGVKDGYFDTYDEQGLFVKGKRSLLFFINAKFHASLMGIVHGAGGFNYTMTVSPALWEKQGGFNSMEELINFIGLNITVNGYLFASINFPVTEYEIMNADVVLDIVFEPGVDFDLAPFGFKTFKFVATERVLGVTVGQDTFDLMALYPGLKEWLQEQIANIKNEMGISSMETMSVETQQAAAQALSTFLADPEATGLEPDPNYEGEYRALPFGVTVAESTDRTDGISTQDVGLRAMAISQGDGIRVESDGKSFTHRINVPATGEGHMLQLEGFGSDLGFEDISVIKPNGQALTIREVASNVTAEQADAGYNAAIIDGVLTLRLSDYANTAGGASPQVTTDYATLSGEWQVTSAKAFKSRLIEITSPADVASVELNGSTVEATFENLNSNDYYYDLVLERKSAPDAAPLETFPLVKNGTITMAGTNGSASFNLGDAELDLASTLPSGDWYPRVTLRQGSVQAYTMNGQDASTLITAYVVDKVSGTSYHNVNTALAGENWNAAFTATSGGNESIALAWNKAVAPAGMATRGYHIALYDSSGALASQTVTGEDGSQSVKSLEYDVQPDEQDSYTYSLAAIPLGSYTVGITPLYADVLTDGTLSPVTRQGVEKMSAAVTINEADPPTLSLQVSGTGNIDESTGYTLLFAGPDATLVTDTSDGATVSITEYDGTPVTFSDDNTLADYVGKTLLITAQNAAKDSTTKLVSVYAALSAPLLLPDNYDSDAGEFIFYADKNTGAYTITGQTDPARLINGVLSGSNGLFSISGMLAADVDEEWVSLAVTNAAGMITMREVHVVRGAQSQPHPYDGRTFNIISDGGQLLDIKWAATTSETPVWLYGQNATVAQQFRFEYVRDIDGLAYYYIVNPNSGMVLDVMGAGTAPGTDVWQYGKNGTNAQLWAVVENGDGTVLIRSALSNHLVLDVEGARFATGTPLQVHPANGTAAQDFTLRDCDVLGEGTYTFVSALDGNIVLDVPGASVAGEVALNTYTANGTAAQRFALDYDAMTGYYTITAECSGLNVDVKAAGNLSESTVWQYTPNGTVAQQWLLVPTGNADEFYVFAATGAGALDVHHARVGDGIPVWTYTPNATAAQRWVLRAA